MSLVQQAQEVQARAEKLIEENARLTNLTREQELAIATLTANNDSLRAYTQRLRAERDQFLRVANAVVTSCGEAKKIFNGALEAAHVSISQFKAEEAPAFSEEDAERLKIVTEGIERINAEHAPRVPKPVIRKLPPNFLMKVEQDLARQK